MFFSQTNFQKVVTWNRDFGVLKETELSPKLHIMREDPHEIESCMKLVREEMRELEEGVANENFVETIDAIGDMLYVLYGMAARMGVDMDHAFDLIHKSNMSKFCKDEKCAQDTVCDAKEKGIFQSPKYRLASSGQGYVVFDENTKKILKSLNYKPVDITQCL